MNIWQALILGCIQGFAEFLPISSSGHLALAQYWFGLNEPLIAFDVFLHGVSLLAIIVFFFAEIKKLRFKQLFLIGLGTLPAVVIGILFKDTLEGLFSTPLLIGVALLITGTNNLISNKLLQKGGPEKEVTFKNALVIGLFQAMALIPGLSRSGTTLIGSLSQKLEKKQAFDFTFLLAIPAIAGAVAIHILEISQGQTEIPAWPLMAAGGIAALVTSLASLGIMKKLIKEARLFPFGIYAIALGLFVIVTSLV